MKTSELVAKLTDALREHGDVDVLVDSSHEEYVPQPVTKVEPEGPFLVISA